MVFNNIQIARGIAALMVLVSHANLMVGPNLFGGTLLAGSYGIHFFFVLSGFIIFYANSKYLATPPKFLPYLFKRIRRIYPIYWIYTLAVIALDLVLTRSTGWSLITWIKVDVTGILWSMSLLPMDLSKGVMPILPVAWTLTYEILFYAVFGISILTSRFSTAVLVCGWIVMILLSTLGIFGEARPFAKVILNPLNLEFLLGCLAGHLVKGKQDSFVSRSSVPILVSGVVILVVSWINVSTGYSLLGKADVLQFGIPFFLIVLGMALIEKNTGVITESGPLKRFAIFLGDASYSIYLVHLPAVVLLVTFFQRFEVFSPYVEFSVVVLIATALGIICYQLIEKPLLRAIPTRLFPSPEEPVIPGKIHP